MMCEGREALNGSGPPDKKEDTMKPLSQSDASKLSTANLYGLRKQAFIAFTGAERDTQDQRDALASMHNIETELKRRGPTP